MFYTSTIFFNIKTKNIYLQITYIALAHRPKLPCKNAILTQITSRSMFFGKFFLKHNENKKKH